ncbi:MAG: hypothetical protein GEU92_02185 [Alphaproteobacteria bacterium]|nr:hypothetical protein [Alphaproteobacteria bacterium]
MPALRRLHRLPAHAAAALLCAALAGCTAGPPAPADGGPPVTAATPGSARPAPETPPAGTASRSPAPGSAIEVDADPKRLAGLDRAGLAKILGKPAFQRLDGPAALLRYRDPACLLDVFLYPPPGKRDAEKRVDHVEARAVDGGAVAVRDCFAALLRARATQEKG